MKISYQQFFIMFLCISQPIVAVTLYNKSNIEIRFNIFKNSSAVDCYNFNLLPKKTGKIKPHTSMEIKDLDPNENYTVTFYDVYNCKNNKVLTFKGSTKKITFKADNAYQEIS